MIPENTDTPLKADCPSAPCSSSYNLLENQKSMTESEIWNANANKAADKYADAIGYVKCCKERTLVFAAFKSGLAYDRDLYKDQNLSQITLSTCDKLFPENSKDQSPQG
jgi:hypothetical protein